MTMLVTQHMRRYNPHGEHTVHIAAILIVLTTLTAFSGCLEKNPIDELAEEEHKIIDPDKGDYEKELKELEKLVQEQTGDPDDQINAADVISDGKTLELIKPSDVTGLFLYDILFYAYPENSSYLPTTFNDPRNRIEYKDVLPIGYKNVGQGAVWTCESGQWAPGRWVGIDIIKYDSNSGLEEGSADRIQSYRSRTEEEMKESCCSFGLPSIGDTNICYYVTKPNEPCPWFDPEEGVWKFDPDDFTWNTVLIFIHDNYSVTVMVTDEKKKKSIDEAIRIAKIIEGRFD